MSLFTLRFILEENTAGKRLGSLKHPRINFENFHISAYKLTRSVSEKAKNIVWFCNWTSTLILTIAHQPLEKLQEVSSENSIEKHKPHWILVIKVLFKNQSLGWTALMNLQWRREICELGCSEFGISSLVKLNFEKKKIYTNCIS